MPPFQSSGDPINFWIFLTAGELVSFKINSNFFSPKVFDFPLDSFNCCFTGHFDTIKTIFLSLVYYLRCLVYLIIYSLYYHAVFKHNLHNYSVLSIKMMWVCWELNRAKNIGLFFFFILSILSIHYKLIWMLCYNHGKRIFNLVKRKKSQRERKPTGKLDKSF